ncbi:MAG: response regulator transcription factor [Erysipelotrichales bacterium]
MKILVVEDELDLQKALKMGLSKKGLDVDCASDGQEALDLYFEHMYDLIVLDLNLPYIDGIEVLEEIRKDSQEVKVIVLSARSEIDHKIIGLDKGANDYLAKPFHFSELEARIRALLRRSFVTNDNLITIKDFKLDLNKRELTKDDEIISLTNKEYGILEYLVLNKGRIISPEELVNHVWNEEDIDYVNTIKVHLNGLRKKIGNEIILNRRGEGYYVK